jgi:SAM-dependent methyltransferase
MVTKMQERTNPTPPADWQLPPGVDRGLWHYLHDDELARRYDESVADAPVLAVDVAFAERHFPIPGRLIDLGCGTGRLSLPFAQQGYWVLGVDLSAEMLKVTGAKAAAAGVVIQRLQANLTALDVLDDRSFDYAACLFSTLGMVRGAEQRRRVVEQVHRILRPGGKFVLHVHNRWFNFWDPRGRRWLVKDLFRSLRGHGHAGDRAMPAHAGLPALTLHLFTRRETLRLLRQAGFRVLDVKPLGLRPDGHLPCAACFGWLRAHGYLVAAVKS